MHPLVRRSAAAPTRLRLARLSKGSCSARTFFEQPLCQRRERAASFAFFFACALALAIGLAPAAAAKDSELRVANGRIPLPIGREDPSVHFAIQSRSEETRTIVGASSPRAESVTIRRTAVVDGQWASEGMPDGMPIPPGGAVAFAPRGLFLRMLGAGKLAPGEKVEIVLEFADGEKLAFEAVVQDG